MLASKTLVSEFQDASQSYSVQVASLDVLSKFCVDLESLSQQRKVVLHKQTEAEKKFLKGFSVTTVFMECQLLKTLDRGWNLCLGNAKSRHPINASKLWLMRSAFVQEDDPTATLTVEQWSMFARKPALRQYLKERLHLIPKDMVELTLFEEAMGKAEVIATELSFRGDESSEELQNNQRMQRNIRYILYDMVLKLIVLTETALLKKGGGNPFYYYPLYQKETPHDRSTRRQWEDYYASLLNHRRHPEARPQQALNSNQVLVSCINQADPKRRKILTVGEICEALGFFPDGIVALVLLYQA